MQTFNESLKYFQAQEEKDSLQKMEKTSRKQRVRSEKGKKKPKRLSCIDRVLFDEPPQSSFVLVQAFYNLLHSTLIILSKLRAGQVVISILDYYCIKIENTLDFCEPCYDFAADEIIDRHRKTLRVQERPMSWIFFIPALIFLRMLRFVLSVWQILHGEREVTVHTMKGKVIAFRRYYRSIRHYAVNKWTDDDLKLIEERKSKWLLLRIYYNVYEKIFMTKRLVEIHDNHEEPQSNEQQQKKSLNASEDDSDNDLTAKELLEKYADREDSITADPDYEPKSSESSSDEIDSDEEKTESQRLFNDEFTQSPESSTRASNTYSSDIERKENEKSNENLAELSQLENEIMTKLMKILKSIENGSFSSENISNEIFYSPIASPPEKAYNSEPEVRNQNHYGDQNHIEQ